MLAFFGFPSNFVFVCEQSADEGGSVVSTHTNQHKSDFSGMSFSFELVFLLSDFSVGDIVAVLVDFYIVVVVGRLNKIVGLELRSESSALDN